LAVPRSFIAGDVLVVSQCTVDIWKPVRQNHSQSSQVHTVARDDR
jgi:hypothetical protein